MQLAMKDVVVSYGGPPILKELSVLFAAERLTVLVGPNGCGKSTLLKAIMGFLPLHSGEITLDGMPVRKINRRSLAKHVAYLPQETHCPDHMTLGELIELAGYARYSLIGGPSARDRALFRDALEIVGLDSLSHRQVNSLSGGQRQRAWIAMVLAQDAKIILMDEPVNHLDVKYQYSVLDLIRKLTLCHGKTVVTVLHDLNLAAAFADDIVMLREGEVMTSGPVEKTVTRANIARVFNLETDVFTRNGRLVCLPRQEPGASYPHE